MSSNWSVEASDLAQCIKKWQALGQFTKLQGRKYSLLLNTQDYFSGTNFKDKDFLIGAASPNEDDRYYIIGYAPPGAYGRNAYVDVVRAANQIKESSTYMAADQNMGKYDSNQVAGGGGGSANSALQQEIQGFIDWINNKEGLGAYIQYYLDQNDPAVISKLAKAYNEFRQVFGF